MAPVIPLGVTRSMRKPTRKVFIPVLARVCHSQQHEQVISQDTYINGARGRPDVVLVERSREVTLTKLTTRFIGTSEEELALGPRSVRSSQSKGSASTCEKEIGEPHVC